MKIKRVKSFYELTADEGKWLTAWTEDTDIILFYASKTIRTTKNRIDTFREISDEEYQTLLTRYEIAIAEQEEENNEEEGDNEGNDLAGAN